MSYYYLRLNYMFNVYHYIIRTALMSRKKRPVAAGGIAIRGKRRLSRNF